MQRRIDIQGEFAKCVRSISGIVLDDLASGPSAPRHADYWFPKHKVLAELKCLTEDLESSPQHRQRIAKLYSSWVRRGLMKGSSNQRLILNLVEHLQT
jgi:hypothetical protein